MYEMLMSVVNIGIVEECTSGRDGCVENWLLFEILNGCADSRDVTH
jgi:hypothetical protein